MPIDRQDFVVRKPHRHHHHHAVQPATPDRGGAAPAAVEPAPGPAPAPEAPAASPLRKSRLALPAWQPAPIGGVPAIPGGRPILTRPGEFFACSDAHPSLDLKLPMPKDRPTDRVCVDFDVDVDAQNAQAINCIAALRGAGPKSSWENWFAGLNVNQKNEKTILDVGKPDTRKQHGPWQAGGRYHVRMDFDAKTHTVTTEIYQDGKLVQSLNAPLKNTDFANGGYPLILGFGRKKVIENTLFPPTGWRFSNLQVQAAEG